VAQRVFGIDLGSYAVKVAVMEVGFRTSRLIQLHTFMLAGGPDPTLDRGLAALDGLPAPRPTDVVALGMPGERVLLRLLEIPFVEPRKLGAVVGGELADDIPWELEDVVYDYAPLPEAPGKVVTVAAQSAEVRFLLERLGEAGLEPRSVTVAPLCYGPVVRKVAPEGAALVVDIGHATSNCCMVVNGRAVAGRTVSRGGHQVTEALRQVYQLSYAEAEALKEERGLVAAEDVQLPQERRQLASTIGQALSPLVRELRLSVGLFASVLGRRPDQVLLCGGTSLLEGLDGYVAAEIQLPTSRLQTGTGVEPGETALTAEGEAIAALSMGIAMEQGGRRGIDLRQGEFAFKTDRSILSEKLVHVAVAVVTVLVFAALSAYMSLYALRKEEKALARQLKVATRQVMGEVVTSPKKVLRLVKRGCRPRAFGIPKKTAFDILDMLSRQIPGRDKIKLDLSRLDIKPGKTYLKGTADSRSAVDDMVSALSKDQCLSKIAKGRISNVSEGKKQFSLTITTSCF